MKLQRILPVLFVLAALLAPATASAYCTTYFDSQAATAYGDSFCWLSGAICFQCWDDLANDCSANWQECDPVPIEEQQYARVLWDEASDPFAARICQTVPESAELDPAQVL